jgi:antitoxin component of MazEF toxin-antitoxin module
MFKCTLSLALFAGFARLVGDGLVVLKVSRIGNSRGIRLPAEMLRKYHITDTIIAEEKTDQIVLHPGRVSRPKLSWKETAQAMAAAKEDWSACEATTGDGLNGL